jgi:hypothetical protein
MPEQRVPRDVAPLLFAAMTIFVLTVVIGILNGTDLMDIPHGLLMAHVHSGTLGWITLSIFAAAAWIVGGERVPRLLRDGSIVVVAFYVAMFWADSQPLRPVAGTLMLAAIVWFSVWTFGQRRGRALTVPRLSMLLAMLNLTIGAVLGVILGLALAGTIDIGDGIAGAHPAMMVVGYLILAGVALDERVLKGETDQPASRLGAIQAWLFFGAGIALAIGILLNVMPLLGLNLLGEIAGVAIVLIRHRREIASAGWPAASARLHAAASLMFTLPALGLLGYLIGRYADDIEAAPRELLLALDHATFIGILTNAIVALLLIATASRRDIWAWADGFVFWAMNLGLIGFVVGLVAEAATIKRVATPVMGAGILLGLLTTAMRLRSQDRTEGTALDAA